MKVTLLLSFVLMAALFLLIWVAVALVQSKKLFTTAPKDIQAAALEREERFAGARILGWTLLVIIAAAFLGAFVYGGWDGIRRGYGFWQFFGRFLTMLYLLKAFDILCLDWFLATPGGHMVYLIDDAYLFTGDTIWFGVDGGRSFINMLAEDNRVAVCSLEALEKQLRVRGLRLKIITGHTGWTDDLDFAFAQRDKVCNAYVKQKPHDPDAPYDAYDESDDTEEKARSVRLKKQRGMRA